MPSSKLFPLFVHMKFDNLAKSDNFFSAFLQKEATDLSKLKVLSIFTPNGLCFLLSASYFCLFNLGLDIFAVKSRKK